MTSPLHKIPAHAHCVFRGALFEVWQWEQVMYNGTTKTFEMIKRPGGATAIVVLDDKILLQDQEQPHRKAFVSLPGGRLEEEEDPKIAVQRELLEETGYTAGKLIHWITIHSPYTTLQSESHFYIAKNCTKTHEMQLDGGEKIHNRLISFEEFLLLSENPLFNNHPLAHLLLQIRLDEVKVEDFRKLLFE